MSKFFKYERTNEAGKEAVFINVSQLSVAVFNQQTGNLTIHMEQGQRETVIGDHATELLKVLDELVPGQE